MYTQTSDPRVAESATGEVLIPLIRAAATIGFAIAPCSLGFVIIAVSEHLIRSIMVGDDPEMLMSEAQGQGCPAVERPLKGSKSFGQPKPASPPTAEPVTAAAAQDASNSPLN